jgi:hypothetical protein
MNLNRLIVTVLTMFGLRALRGMGRHNGDAPRGAGGRPSGRQSETMRAAKRAARTISRINR